MKNALPVIIREFRDPQKSIRALEFQIANVNPVQRIFKCQIENRIVILKGDDDG